MKRSRSTRHLFTNIPVVSTYLRYGYDAYLLSFKVWLSLCFAYCNVSPIGCGVVSCCCYLIHSYSVAVACCGAFYRRHVCLRRASDYFANTSILSLNFDCLEKILYYCTVSLRKGHSDSRYAGNCFTTSLYFFIAVTEFCLCHIHT